MTKEQADQAIENICREVSELPDRTSPDDNPDMMLVSQAELKEILTVAFQDIGWIVR